VAFKLQLQKLSKSLFAAKMRRAYLIVVAAIAGKSIENFAMH